MHKGKSLPQRCCRAFAKSTSAGAALPRARRRGARGRAGGRGFVEIDVSDVPEATLCNEGTPGWCTLETGYVARYSSCGSWHRCSRRRRTGSRSKSCRCGSLRCRQHRSVGWLGYNAGRVVGTVGATDSDRGGGNMLKENAEATAALGAASRCEVEGGQYAGIG